MRKKVIDNDIVEIIGVYGIIKYKEKWIWDNGKVFGTESGYDVVLDKGEGDIVASFDKIKDARKWAKEN